MATGLRERKKERTRETVVREAMVLFRRQGFDATTVAEIADAADIAPRTFFAYFDTKEAVVFHDFELLRDRFAERLRARTEDETTFDALRAWVVEWIGEGGFVAKEERARRKLIRATPALQAHEHANRAVFEGLIAESVARDLDVAPDSLRARMVAAAAVAALSALDEDASREPESAIGTVDEALVFLQGGLGSLRRRPPL
jgi:AcrR family transcriptional regulator